MSADLIEFAELASLGFAIGGYGTMVGAGGGSLLVPVLLFLLPNESAATLTSISLAVVFFNAYSGSLAYMRMGRVDYYAGFLFALAGVPGAIVGALLVQYVPRDVFDPGFGVMLLALGAFLALSPLQLTTSAAAANADSPNLCVGAIGSAYIAVLSSLLGIGGGILHVPLLIRVLRMPPHTAAATSQFVLTFMALTATLVHIATGEFSGGIHRAAYLGIGVMMGAPVGAAISVRLRGSLIVRLLAVALCLVGLRLIARVF